MSTFDQVDGRFSQGNTMTKSASNNKTAEGNTMSESSRSSNLEYTPATTFEDFNDCGFFENDIASTVRAEYKDWTLYNDELVDVDTSRFFADIDASVIAHNGSVYERTESENSTIMESGATGNPQAPNRMESIPYDPVHEAVQKMAREAVQEAVQQVMKQDNFDVARDAKGDFKFLTHRHQRAQDSEPTILCRLETWVSTRHRHEYIAYLLEQPPYPARDFLELEEIEQYTQLCSCDAQ